MTNEQRTSPDRKVYCNRTLNMRSIRAIGYDMDYTLVHYHVEEWERRAYERIRTQLIARGWPVEGLEFDPTLVCRGLIIDTELGNVVKSNQFGFVKRAMHGTAPLEFEAQRKAYSRTIVDLGESRWIFLNTLFSLSEGCLYAQLVDLLDQRKIPEVLGYADLYERLKYEMDTAHMEGLLKAEILAEPERFVILDPETPLSLLDQFYAGKRLMLITNSEWSYTVPMMTYAFDRFLPEGMTWRDLFEVVIVGARKPRFFTGENPLFEVATEDGLLRPSASASPFRKGTAYFGGSAGSVEKYLGLSGDEILYVGDHMFGDVHVTKSVLRWRTALILREIEEDIRAVTTFRPKELALATLMVRKEELEQKMCDLRLRLQRIKVNYGKGNPEDPIALEKKLDELRAVHIKLDSEIAALAKQGMQISHPLWGLMMRAGNDKSHLAFQMERYADIYTSRVSNLLYATPFVYFRSARGSLPHDPALT